MRPAADQPGTADADRPDEPGAWRPGSLGDRALHRRSGRDAGGADEIAAGQEPGPVPLRTFPLGFPRKPSSFEGSARIDKDNEPVKPPLIEEALAMEASKLLGFLGTL